MEVYQQECELIPEGTGVCLGYAYAFKILSDEIGLENVVVYGSVGTVGHAWNRAKIDGKWRVFDVTWNDSPGSEQKYFNITEAQLQELSPRGNDSRWMNPMFIDKYNAV